MATAGDPDGRLVPNFSVYYVHERQERDDGEWLFLGPDRLRPPTAWMRADQTVPWNHLMSLTFNMNPDRAPVLFFEDKDSLEATVFPDDRAQRAEALIQAYQANGAPPDSGLFFVEPRPVVDFNSSFYLMPVLKAQELRLRGMRRGQRLNMVEVAGLADPDTPPQTAAAEPEPFRAGMVFVIDTTKSMQPYIDRAHQVVKDILSQVTNTEAGKRMSFGLVGYRDSLRDNPAIEYVAKTFYPLKREFDQTAFLSALGSMKAATASTTDFREDTMAGVQEALSQSSWREFDARIIVVITDAPMRQGRDDTLRSNDLDPATLARDQSSEVNTTAFFSFYLDTPAGRAHVDAARGSLGKLSTFGDSQTNLMFELPDGDLEAYTNQIRLFNAKLFNLMDDAQGTQLNAAPATPQEEEMVHSMDEVMQVMRLAWARRNSGEPVPKFFRAMALDFDPTDRSYRRSVEINVLLNKNQLNDLYQALGFIAEASADQIDNNTDSFITKVREVVAQAQLDPSSMESLDPSASSVAAMQPEEIENLSDVLAAYVGYLPYESPLLSLDPASLRNRGPTFYSDLILRLDGLRAMYKHYSEDLDRWVKLNPEASDAEKVYPVPLDLLP
jgi:hypothetical protein